MDFHIFELKLFRFGLIFLLSKKNFYFFFLSFALLSLNLIIKGRKDDQ